MGVTYFYSQQFLEQGFSKKQVDIGYELLGVSLSADGEGYITWVNFLLWPEGRQMH